MSATRKLDELDTKMVFWVYAGVAGLVGLLLVGWGAVWFGSDLPGLPHGKAALIRIAGASFVAAACFAAAMAGVDDAVARRRGLLWFASGHFFIFVIASTQRIAILGERLPEWVALAPFTASLLLFYAWQQAGWDQRGMPGILTTLMNDPGPSAQHLRSAYGQQIRAAARHEERHRLARDLHDAVKQQLFVVQTSAATVEARFDQDPDGARCALEQVRSAAREAMAEMEAMLDQLRGAPLEVKGLVEALRKQCEALGFRTGAHVEFRIGALPPSDALGPGGAEAVFHAGQEALANIGRHARASNVTVTLDAVGGKLELAVSDDGQGFDTNLGVNGMGLRNLRERAEECDGVFEVSSQPQRGTTIRFSVPVAIRDNQNYLAQVWLWSLSSAVFITLSLWYWNWGFVFVYPMSLLALVRSVSAYRLSRANREMAR